MATKLSATVKRADLLLAMSDIVSAFVGHNKVTPAELPHVIGGVHQALAALAAGERANGAERPAVPIDQSVTPDFVICLEDGKKLKMLRRYLRTHFNLTPEEYRRKWRLPADYPMVAPNYSKRRSRFAKEIGLGRTARAPARKRAAAKSTR